MVYLVLNLDIYFSDLYFTNAKFENDISITHRGPAIGLLFDFRFTQYFNYIMV